jgi:hypothetical protein
MDVEVGFACGDCTHANGPTSREEADLWRVKRSRVRVNATVSVDEIWS